MASELGERFCHVPNSETLTPGEIVRVEGRVETSYYHEAPLGKIEEDPNERLGVARSQASHHSSQQTPYCKTARGRGKDPQRPIVRGEHAVVKMSCREHDQAASLTFSRWKLDGGRL